MPEKKKPTKKSVQFGPPPDIAPAPAPVPKKPAPPAPAPLRYRIEGNGQDAMKNSFRPRKPAGGSPK